MARIPAIARTRRCRCLPCLAWRRGHTNQLTFLASFVKSPYGLEDQDFTRQFQMLEAWGGKSDVVLALTTARDLVLLIGSG